MWEFDETENYEDDLETSTVMSVTVEATDTPNIYYVELCYDYGMSSVSCATISLN